MSEALILHADESWIVAGKPAGLPAVPGRAAHLHDCLSARVQALFADALVVHRLDMATSGLLLFARGADMQRALSRAFAARAVHKRYIAVVQGCMQGDTGRIDLPLAADWPNRPKQQVDAERGKPAQTNWRVLARGAHRTRVELAPLTGRTHQLRVHLAAIGHPMLGDALYAPPEVQAMASRLLLHASELELVHPRSGAVTRFKSPAPF